MTIFTKVSSPGSSKMFKDRKWQLMIFLGSEVIFQLKKWNHFCLWQWDVDNDVCAICRIVILEPYLNVSFSSKYLKWPQMTLF